MKCSCPSSLLQSLSSQLFPLLPNLSNHSILHILQFFIIYADSLQDGSSIVNLAGFFFSSVFILLQHYFQLLTAISRILQIEEIIQIIQNLPHNQDLNSSLTFPFFFSILRFHSQDSFSEDNECIFTSLLIESCKEGMNVGLSLIDLLIDQEDNSILSFFRRTSSSHWTLY